MLPNQKKKKKKRKKNVNDSGNSRERHQEGSTSGEYVQDKDRCQSQETWAHSCVMLGELFISLNFG